MDKFIPREKLSKKKQRELDRQARRDWNGLNPATRRPEDPKIYNRKKSGVMIMAIIHSRIIYCVVQGTPPKLSSRSASEEPSRLSLQYARFFWTMRYSSIILSSSFIRKDSSPVSQQVHHFHVAPLRTLRPVRFFARRARSLPSPMRVRNDEQAFVRYCIIKG